MVDRLLIRPLRRLRSTVQRYRPGEEIVPAWTGAMPAQEIRELGDTFREISRTVQTHEAGLAEGLVRQTRLTREVHHRVKNNLQVISSLINFHARGAKSAEATEPMPRSSAASTPSRWSTATIMPSWRSIAGSSCAR
ncbi:MAG: histidine kinase dimerization/phosphoacceptor domain -containing protein [Sphingomonas sp.]